MKGRHYFAIATVLLFVLGFVSLLWQPKHYVWKPTYSHTDEQPLGSYVFDSVMRAAKGRDYKVQNVSFEELAKKRWKRRKGFLLVSSFLNLNAKESKSILKLAAAGHTVMLACNELYSSTLTDSLALETSRGFDEEPSLSNETLNQSYKDTLTWLSGGNGYPMARYEVSRTLIGGNIFCDNRHATVYESHFYEPEDTVQIHYRTLVSAPYKKGNIILSTTPLMFTNYAVLDSSTTFYSHRMMSLFGKKQVTRLDSSLELEEEEQALLRYIAKQPPLNLALWLLLLVCLLFIVFTSRRKQHAIPILKAPGNYSIAFVEQVGNLYHREKQTTDLVQKKYLYLVEELRRRFFINLEDETEDKRNFSIIAGKTGLKLDTVTQRIKDLRFISHLSYDISEGEMKQYINNINEIIEKIK